MLTDHVWSALGDPTRRAILDRLADEPRAVGDLAAEFPISRPAISQHLKVLKEAGLVVDRPAGNRRIYHVDPAGLHALRAQLDRFWGRVLTTFKEVVEQPTEEAPMVPETQVTSVRTQIVVQAPVERAFRVFTEQFDRIKPREHNLLGVDIEETVFEPRVGGHVYDRGVDGSECRWARVLAYEPPHRLLISWDIDPRWRVEKDPAKTSEVEIRFVAESPERTRVELEHRHLDRHGEGWEAERDGVAADQGWPLYLRRFRSVLEG